MATGPTNRPVPSDHPADARNNFQRVDDIVSSDELTTTTRTGKVVETFAGIAQKSFRQINRVGFEVPVAYANGLVMSRTSQTVTFMNEVYHAINVPFTTSGTFETNNFELLRGATNADLSTAQEQVLGASSSIFPTTINTNISNGSSVPSGATHLRVSGDIVTINPVASGVISALTSSGCMIGGTAVIFGGSADTSSVLSSGSTVTRTLAERFAEKVNVKDYPSISAAITYAESIPGVSVLEIPSGTYTLTSGLTIDVSKMRIDGQSAILDFSGLSTGSAITLIGGGRTQSGAPFLNGFNPIGGVELIGPGRTSAGSIGLNFSDTDLAGSNDITTMNALVHDFETGIEAGNNAYHLSFTSVSVFLCDTCFRGRQFSNTGARTTFVACKLFNSDEAFDLENASSGTTTLIGCVVAGINNTSINIEGGALDIYGCDFETGNAPASDYRIIHVNSASTNTTNISIHGGRYIVKQPTTTPAFDIDSPALFRWTGGDIFMHHSSTGGVFGGTGTSLVILYGPQIDNGTTNPIKATESTGMQLYRHLANLNSIVAENLDFTTTGDIRGDSLTTDSGVITSSGASVTITATGVWVPLTVGGSAGLLKVIDRAGSGQRMDSYQCEGQSTGFASRVLTSPDRPISNLSIGYPAGVLSVQISSGGTVPRTLNWAFNRMSSN